MIVGRISILFKGKGYYWSFGDITEIIKNYSPVRTFTSLGVWFKG
jgi:hypothetical protein